MKTDRFVKVMLVIIAGLLLLNCFNNGSGIFPPKAKASVPAFIQVGNSYSCGGAGMLYNITKEDQIMQIDSNNGWIEINGKLGKRWINAANLYGCDSKP